MLPCLLLIVSFLFCFSVPAHCRSYRSPDGSCTASITARPNSEGSHEATVNIYHCGRLSIQRSFVSADGNHGQNIEHAAWTSNSRFFVFTTFSSGGHSAWHHWTFVWSRRDNKIHSLDDAYYPQTAGTMAADFRLTAPDRISTLLADGSNSGRPLSVRLSQVHWKPGLGDRR